MRTAVVFGARQRFGFEICVQLLDKGYVVRALEHEQWQTEEAEEKWMLIGRNANLTYDELKQGRAQSLVQSIKEDSIYIIPLIDYYFKQIKCVQDQLVRQFQLIATCDLASSFFVFLHPSALNREQVTFAKESEVFIQSLRKKGVSLLEYYLPSVTSNHQDRLIFMKQAERGQWKEVNEQLFTTESLTLAFVQEVIAHLEKGKVFHT